MTPFCEWSAATANANRVEPRRQLQPVGDDGSSCCSGTGASNRQLDREFEPKIALAWPVPPSVERSLALIFSKHLAMPKNDQVAASQARSSSESACSRSAAQSYKQARNRVLEEFERRFVSQLLAEAKGNVALAARHGQMDRTYLIKLIRRHGLRSL